MMLASGVQKLESLSTGGWAYVLYKDPMRENILFYDYKTVT
jgi:hypothetical protein